jgi:hypothetical protein
MGCRILRVIENRRGAARRTALARDRTVAFQLCEPEPSSSATTSGCRHSPGKHGQPFGSVPMFYAQTCATPKLRRPHPVEPGMGRTGRCRPGMQLRGHGRRTRP